MPGDHPVNPDIDFLAGEFYAGDPHAAWRWMRAHAPVYWDERNLVWGISRYDDIMMIERTPKVFSNAQGIRPDSGPLPMMISTDAPEHIRRRKLVSARFTPLAVSQQRQRIREICDALIDEVCEKGECDFVWDLAAWLPLIVIGDMLGFPVEDRATLMRWSDDLMRGTTSTDPAALEKATAAAGEWAEWVMGQVEDRRRNPKDDLVTALVQAEIPGPDGEPDKLDDESLQMELLLILIGGDETTRHVISGGNFELMRHPDQHRRLVDDRSLLPTAVEELLRWVTPIKNMSRHIVEDVEIRGQHLAAGEQLLLFYPSANRDEDVFADPDRFDIARSPNPHIAFGGHGPHYCLGHNLARLEITEMFNRLLDRIPDMEYAGDLEPPMRPANFVAGHEKMPVRFSPTRRLGG
jgi:cytochrome P450 family 142 subfamily A polypeptide 1